MYRQPEFARQPEFQNEIFVLVFQKRVLELLVHIKANQKRLGRAYKPKDSQAFVKHCKNLEEYEELESLLKDKRTKSLLLTSWKRK